MIQALWVKKGSIK